MSTHVIRTTAGRVGARIVQKQTQMREAMRAAALESATRTIPRVRALSPVDQGHYINSWEVVEPAGGNTLAEIRNDAPHAGIIELGARPGFWPPLGPLYEWVLRHTASFDLGRRIKRGKLTKVVGGQRVRTASADQRLAAMRIARSIQRAIHARGLPPHRVMARSLPHLRRYYKESFDRRLRTIAGQT